MGKSKNILSALEEIRLSNGGILSPAGVVEAARRRDHPLHDRFEWDDTEAARQYRLWQARELILATVTVLPGSDDLVRVYVSLQDDRGGDGGYRAMVDVLQDKELYSQMMMEALEDFQKWQRKYRAIAALRPVFRAADRVRSRLLAPARK